MKYIFLIATCFTVVFLSGCSSYPNNATKPEIWKARYEQNIILASDDTETTMWKATKHTLWDFGTLLFAEIQYGRIRRNYRYWQQVIDEYNFYQSFVGKNKAKLFLSFGAPQQIYSDTNIDILIWKKVWITGGEIYGNIQNGNGYIASTPYRRNERNLQFFCNKDGKIICWKSSEPKFLELRKTSNNYILKI